MCEAIMVVAAREQDGGENSHTAIPGPMGQQEKRPNDQGTGHGRWNTKPTGLEGHDPTPNLDQEEVQRRVVLRAEHGPELGERALGPEHRERLVMGQLRSTGPSQLQGEVEGHQSQDQQPVGACERHGTKLSFPGEGAMHHMVGADAGDLERCTVDPKPHPEIEWHRDRPSIAPQPIATAFLDLGKGSSHQ